MSSHACRQFSVLICGPWLYEQEMLGFFLIVFYTTNLFFPPK